MKANLSTLTVCVIFLLVLIISTAAISALAQGASTITFTAYMPTPAVNALEGWFRNVAVSSSYRNETFSGHDGLLIAKQIGINVDDADQATSHPSNLLTIQRNASPTGIAIKGTPGTGFTIPSYLEITQNANSHEGVITAWIRDANPSQRAEVYLDPSARTVTLYRDVNINRDLTVGNDVNIAGDLSVTGNSQTCVRINYSSAVVGNPPTSNRTSCEGVLGATYRYAGPPTIDYTSTAGPGMDNQGDSHPHNGIFMCCKTNGS